MLEKNGFEEDDIPVHMIWDQILLIPINGIIDSLKGQTIMETILSMISQTSSKIVILDILGVATVDSAVANHLIKISRAVGLMGAECIISGISPAVAQTIVSLGLDLGDIETKATLKDALAKGLRLLNYKIISTEDQSQ